MEPTAVAALAREGGLFLYSVVITYFVWRLITAYQEKERELAAEKTARLADRDSFVERMLAASNQHLDVAKAANATTITNTAALEGNRIALEKVLAQLSKES